MLFNYQAVDQGGTVTSGSIDAINRDVAISSLQRRGLTISAIDAADGAQPIWKKDISLFARISNKDIVILSRQIATLFEAQVSALHVFRLLATETPNPELGKKLTEVADDLQGGNSISNALGKHPKAFSSFYVGMVRAGEESGKLDQTFSFLADYLDRTYEVGVKARNALIYPAFVIGGIFFWRFMKTERGQVAVADLQLSTPFVGDLYRKLYLSRIADNLSTMLTSGIQMVRAVEITAGVVGNPRYERLPLGAGEKRKE